MNWWLNIFATIILLSWIFMGYEGSNVWRNLPGDTPRWLRSILLSDKNKKWRYLLPPIILILVNLAWMLLSQHQQVKTELRQEKRHVEQLQSLDSLQKDLIESQDKQTQEIIKRINKTRISKEEYLKRRYPLGHKFIGLGGEINDRYLVSVVDPKWHEVKLTARRTVHGTIQLSFENLSFTFPSGKIAIYDPTTIELPNNPVPFHQYPIEIASVKLTELGPLFHVVELLEDGNGPAIWAIGILTEKPAIYAFTDKALSQLIEYDLNYFLIEDNRIVHCFPYEEMAKRRLNRLQGHTGQHKIIGPIGLSELKDKYYLRPQLFNWQLYTELPSN